MVVRQPRLPFCFGARLRQAREWKGLAQDKLGVLTGLDEGCSSARISRYETGVHQPPFETARNLARVLNVPVAFFYCEDDWLAHALLHLDRLNTEQKSQFDNWRSEQTANAGN